MYEHDLKSEFFSALFLRIENQIVQLLVTINTSTFEDGIKNFVFFELSVLTISLMWHCVLVCYKNNDAMTKFSFQHSH